NGIHLNDAGYYFLAGVLEKAFGWPDRGEKITVDASAISSRDGEKVVFGVEEKLLPLPVPAGVQGVYGTAAHIQVTGLKSGRYTLKENGDALVTATAEEWNKGIVLAKGSAQAQVAQLRDSIARKNELFFHQYRPLNR